jgi:hypothetical protein
MATKKAQTKLMLKLEEVLIVEDRDDTDDEVFVEVKPKRRAKKSPPAEVLEHVVAQGDKSTNENFDPTGLYCHSCKTKTADVDLKEASCKGRTPESAERRTLSATCKTCNKKKHSFAKKI